MSVQTNMIYWKGKDFWVGKLLDHPDIMSQGVTVEELEENLKEAYLLMAMDDVPEEHKIKAIAIP
jgi:predicted RNase H-like HicB family nuclease